MSATRPFAASDWPECPRPAKGIMLGSQDVHVWRVPLDAPSAVCDKLRARLSEDEMERAARFHFDVHRLRFIVARGALRTILAGYLAMDPRDVAFQYGAKGKPSLAQAPAAGDIRFNLSHSDDLALAAVTLGREVGVDLERVRKDLDLFSLAERNFSADEVETLRSVPAAKRHEAFFNCWTRKEAYIKARGEGFSLPLDRFCVSLRPSDVPALLSSQGDPREVGRWSMAALHPGPGFIAALVVEGRDYRIQCWQWAEAVE